MLGHYPLGADGDGSTLDRDVAGVLLNRERFIVLGVHCTFLAYVMAENAERMQVQGIHLCAEARVERRRRVDTSELLESNNLFEWLPK